MLANRIANWINFHQHDYCFKSSLNLTKSPDVLRSQNLNQTNKAKKNYLSTYVGNYVVKFFNILITLMTTSSIDQYIAKISFSCDFIYFPICLQNVSWCDHQWDNQDCSLLSSADSGRRQASTVESGQRSCPPSPLHFVLICNYDILINTFPASLRPHNHSRLFIHNHFNIVNIV